MKEEPTVANRAEQPYVSIPIAVTPRDWGRANALVGEVLSWLDRKGIPLAGAPFFRYWTIGDHDRPFALEVGAPVARPVPVEPPAHAGSMPAGRYVTLVDQGHPDRLDRSFDRLEEWAARQGLEWKQRGPDHDPVWEGRFEFYLTDPAEQPDLEKWSVEVAVLVRDGEKWRTLGA